MAEREREISSKACLLHFPLGNAVFERILHIHSPIYNTCKLPIFPWKSQPPPNPTTPFSCRKIAYKSQLNFLMAPPSGSPGILKNKWVNKKQPFGLSAYHLISKKVWAPSGQGLCSRHPVAPVLRFQEAPNRSLTKGINGKKSTKEGFFKYTALS